MISAMDDAGPVEDPSTDIRNAADVTSPSKTPCGPTTGYTDCSEAAVVSNASMPAASGRKTEKGAFQRKISLMRTWPRTSTLRWCAWAGLENLSCFWLSYKDHFRESERWRVEARSSGARSP